MSVADRSNNSNRYNFPWQFNMLELLGTIASNTTGAGGADYELYTRTYQVTTCTVPCGPGYSLNDIVTSIDIILVPAGTISSTLWYNNTTGLYFVPAPPIVNLTPYSPVTPGVVRTPTVFRDTAAVGSPITMGKSSISIANTGGVAGTVNGIALNPGETVNFSVTTPGDTLAAVTYNATGTNFLITYIV